MTRKDLRERKSKMFTNTFSGQQLGLVKDHTGLTLDQARSGIEKPHLNDYPYSVHVVSII